MAAADKQILERIKKDAQTEAAALRDAANKLASERLQQEKEKLELEKVVKLEAAHAALVREQEQREQIKRNELKKAVLENKQEVLTRVFNAARAALMKMSSADSARLAAELGKKYAKPGDVITKTGIGIVVKNNKYEIKLTLDELLAELRDEIESDVSKILFGGG